MCIIKIKMSFELCVDHLLLTENTRFVDFTNTPKHKVRTKLL